MWAGALSSIPQGWVLCNGSNGTPNLQDRFVVGAGHSYRIGDTGGASNVTLTLSEMPRHGHEVLQVAPATSDWPRNPAVYSGGITNIPWFAQRNGGSNGWLAYQQVLGEASFHFQNPYGSQSSVYADASGGNQPFNNLPPYFALAYLMKV